VVQIVQGENLSTEIISFVPGQESWIRNKKSPKPNARRLNKLVSFDFIWCTSATPSIVLFLQRRVMADLHPEQ